MVNKTDQKNLFFSVRIILLIIAFGTISLHIVKLSTNHWVIGSDGLGYYAHIRSLIIDHDLDYENEFRDFNPFGHSVQNFRQRTRTGYVANKYPIGPALLWAPFFIAAHVLTIGINHLGFNLQTNGYSFLYQLFTGAGTTFYGVLGLYFIFKIVNRYFSSKISASAIGAIFLSTNLIHYFICEPSMAHILSMFSVSLFLYLCLKDFDKKTTSSFLFCGLTAGLMTMMRYQNALFAIVPLIELSIGCFRRGFSWKKFSGSMKMGIVLLAAAGFAFLPQLLVLKVIFGLNTATTSTATTFAGSGDYMLNSFNYFTPKLLSVLFSPHHGLIYWTPIIFICLIGMILFSQKKTLQGTILLSCFILQWYINAAWHDWTFGNAFGARAFINCTAIFTLGLATVFDRYAVNKKTITLMLIFIITANLSFMSQFLLKIIPQSEPVTWSTVIAGNFDLITMLKSKVSHLLKRIN
ncbi:MAG: glycosyltransferase family 39 protein [Deltaproteobacteria bacterium]|nr:glycosyltransferase family 39 protein [Deltaproteobacteria bacterium]